MNLEKWRSAWEIYERANDEPEAEQQRLLEALFRLFLSGPEQFQKVTPER
jgi:hypothetical protein